MATPVGHQTPRHLWVPPHESSAGREAVDLAASAGLILDPWQRLVLDGALSETGGYQWACFEVCCVVSRQNGKGSILEALELAGLFLFGDRLIIHSAHRFATSKEHFYRIQQLIQSSPDLDREVKRITNSHGEEAIELKSGQRLKFMARSGGGGRGFTGDRIVFDEAMYLDAMQMAAMLPTLSTRPNAQVWYTGSAGMKQSSQLALLRRRGIAGGDPSLAYFEWSVDERPVKDGGDDRSDPGTWAKANPGLGIRITTSYVTKEMAAMGGPDSLTFGMERLGIGDWPDEEEAWSVIPRERWEAARLPGSRIAGPIAFGVDAAQSGQWGVVGVYGLNFEGQPHYEIAHRQPGTAWLVPWLVERVRVWRPSAVVILPTSPAATIISRLADEGISVLSPSTAEYGQHCGWLFEDVAEGGIARHLNQPSLNRAVGGAQKRDLPEGGWAWSRKVSAVDISPLVSVTLARFGFAEKAGKDRVPLATHSASSIIRPIEPPVPSQPFAGYLPDQELARVTQPSVGASAFAAAKRGDQ